MKNTIPREHCMYGHCRAVNLCKGSHCVGYSLLENSNLLMENGTIREATPEEKKAYLARHDNGDWK